MKTKVRLWDFGGQEITHTTHQFFLSKRSLYILVLDGRKDEKNRILAQPYQNLRRDSTVLVVLNKMDELKKETRDVETRDGVLKRPNSRETFFMKSFSR